MLFTILFLIIEILLGYLYPFMRSVESLSKGCKGGRKTEYWIKYWIILNVLNKYVFSTMSVVLMS